MMTNLNYIVSSKFLMALGMIFGHCLIYASIYFPHTDILEKTLFNYQMRSFLIVIVGSIPVLAGVVHYFQNKNQINIRSTLNICLFLIFIEGIKNAIIVGRFLAFFHFDVLFLIGISLLIIDILRKVNFYLPALISLVLIYLNQFFEWWRFKFLFNDMTYYRENFQIISMSIFCIFAILVAIMSSLKLFPKYKKLLILVLFVLLSISYKMFFVELLNPRFQYHFFNFPLGSLIGIYHSYHVWPLLVWMPLIVFGFYFAAILEKTAKKYYAPFLILIPSFVYVYIYNKYIFTKTFVFKMLTPGLGTEAVFFIDWWRILYHMAILPIFLYLVMLIEYFFSLSTKNFTKIAGRWILFIYLTSLFVPNYMAPLLSKKVDFLTGLFLMTIVNLLCCFTIAYILDVIVFRLKIRFKLEKVK